jgi:hypothetical protein
MFAQHIVECGTVLSGDLSQRFGRHLGEEEIIGLQR